MKEHKIGLVLEGGGMRGAFTAGVLDYFMDQNLYMSPIYCVSAGACHAVNYVSHQRGRSKTIHLEYCNDKRYMSVRNLLFKKSFFGSEFIFDEMPRKQVPFDYAAYYQSNMECYVGATNLLTGKCDFFSKDESMQNTAILKASCALPLMAKKVYIHDIPYLDGGIADSIPIQKAWEDGCEKVVVILTQDETYQKTSSSSIKLAQKVYKSYPQFLRKFEERHLNYNHTRHQIKEWELQQKVFPFYPPNPVTVKRVEKDVQNLSALYEEGYKEAQKRYDSLCAFLTRDSFGKE